jgi:hypothetical protein
MLARFHAAAYGAPEEMRAGRWGFLREQAPDSRDHIGRYLAPEVWNGYVASPRGAAGSVKLHDAAWMAEALEKMIRYAEGFPQSVIHADTHLGNLYVEADGTPGFFDPICTRAPPMMEVAYHVCCALDLADRPRWEAALVQHYLDEMERCGVEPPRFDDAMAQYAVWLARGWGIFLINQSEFQDEDVNTAYAARFSAAMIDHDSIGRIAALR